MGELSEQIQEAMDLVRMSKDDIEDEEIRADLETAIEILEEVEHSLGLDQEMDQLMGQHEENLEDLDEL